MSTITFTGSNFCAGNGHFTVTISNAITATRNFSANQIVGNPLTADEKDELLGLLLRFGATGKTPAQAKTWITAGVDVVVG